MSGAHLAREPRRERRAGPRRPLELAVFLFQHGAPVGLAVVRDASAEGLFVSPLPDVVPPARVGHVMELGFGETCGAITRQHRVMVRVVRRCEDGLGLAVERADPAAAAAMEAAAR